MKDKILSHWFEGFNRRDWKSVEEIYDENALIHGRDEKLRGGKAVVKLAENWLKAFPDMNIRALHADTEDNDVVVVHWRTEGTMTGPMWDIEPTGKKVSFHGITCFRCDRGKVVEHWASIDYQPLEKIKHK